MDVVTHSLVGVALSRACFQRVTQHATLLLILATTIPDIDIFSLVGGQLTNLEWQRGYTHSLIAVPILALLCVGLTAVIVEERLSFLWAWAIACVGVLSHLLLDWTGSFGIRALLPFSSRWLYLDLNGNYDGVILTALALGLAWPWFVNLVSGEIGKSRKYRGQGSAITVLLFLLLYECGRWSLHEKALNDLNSRLYDGEVPVAVSVLADANNPMSWTGIVETQDAFRVVETGTLDIGNATDARIFSKTETSVAYRAAMKTEPFRYMAYFARFPVWGIEPVLVGAKMETLLDLTDLRFGTPGSGKFHACALTDGKGQILASKFGFSPTGIRDLLLTK